MPWCVRSVVGSGPRSQTGLTNPVSECTLPVDVVFRSSDQILIGAHKANLAQFSEGFPHADAVADPDQPVELSEDSQTLRLLLPFCHVQRYPDLATVGETTILALAYAAEKYMVQSAAAVCAAHIL